MFWNMSQGKFSWVYGKNTSGKEMLLWTLTLKQDAMPVS